LRRHIDERWGIPKKSINGGKLNQLRRIFEYLAPDCQSAVREHHYIDRHFMEDHGALYAHNFSSSSNFCERVHFFRCSAEQTEKRLLELMALRRASDGQKRLSEESACFAEANYLGFTVLKPLPGTPVGRTVLQPRAGSGDKLLVEFTTRPYVIHLGGITFSICGAAFQEQDIGVSACATTALWSSLQQLKHSEQFGVATPAEITSLAGNVRMPSGRAMIASGLTLEEMSRAVTALGLMPQVVDTYCQPTTARFVLECALRSGFAPVLLIRTEDSVDDGHAVTATALRYDPVRVRRRQAGKIGPKWGNVSGLYIHDDRIGPYLPVQLDTRESEGRTITTIGPLRGYDTFQDQHWDLRTVLLPVNAQIKFPLPQLERYIWDLMEELCWSWSDDDHVRVESWISRPYTYFECELMTSRHDVSDVFEFHRSIAVPRYVGVVRIASTDIGEIDVLVDMTSTPGNEIVVAIVGRQTGPAHDAAIATLQRFSYDPPTLRAPAVKRVR
jgi:hypothetical protein